MQKYEKMKQCCNYFFKTVSAFVRHRRECWAHVSPNCPVMVIKQKILEHEYEEIIRDDFSKYGPLRLIIRQGRSVICGKENSYEPVVKNQRGH